MDERVHVVRTRQWAEVIAACNSSGQRKSDWLAEHGISRRQFYYWQRKLRGELYEAAENKTCTELELHTESKPAPTFAELRTVPASVPVENRFCADAVIRVGVVTMEISNSASKQLVDSLGRVISNALQRNRV